MEEACRLHNIRRAATKLSKQSSTFPDERRARRSRERGNACIESGIEASRLRGKGSGRSSVAVDSLSYIANCSEVVGSVSTAAIKGSSTNAATKTLSA